MSEFHGSTENWEKAELESGIRIAYRIHRGKGSGRVVLVHALAMNARFWDQVAPHVEAAEILVYDCRGHGASSASDQTYSGDMFARDLADLLDHLGWEKAVIAGASMGGCVALAFAAAYPERTEGLGLFDTTAWYGAEAPANWAARGEKGLQEGLAALVPFQLDRWFSADYAQANPGVVENLISTFTATDPASYRRTCLMLGGFDARAALPDLTMPCEVVVGSEDKATPVAMAEALAAETGTAHLTILEDVHHFSPIEAPEAISAALNRVLSRVG